MPEFCSKHEELEFSIIEMKSDIRNISQGVETILTNHLPHLEQDAKETKEAAQTAKNLFNLFIGINGVAWAILAMMLACLLALHIGG